MSVAPPTSALLEVANVSIRFGGLQAVQNFSLNLPEAGLYGLIGPNGAGKTTVFNLLTGIYRPNTGTVRLRGQDLIGRFPHEIAAQGVARTFQNIRLFAELTVLDNVRLACQLRGSSTLWNIMLGTARHLRDEIEVTNRSLELLSLFQLAGRAEDHARNLSYGDQRRLEIVRALATRPSLLLLDEPAAGLNPQEKKELARTIRHLQESFKVAILLIEHDMGLVMEICEHITVLDHGVTIAVGTPDEVRNNPVVIEAYLGAPLEPEQAV